MWLPADTVRNGKWLGICMLQQIIHKQRIAVHTGLIEIGHYMIAQTVLQIELLCAHRQAITCGLSFSSYHSIVIRTIVMRKVKHTVRVQHVHTDQKIPVEWCKAGQIYVDRPFHFYRC